MKWLSSLFLLASITCCSIPAFSQSKEVISWSYDVKHAGKGQYELRFHARMEPSWHLYSLQPGGDGTLIPPSFTFKLPATARLQGKVKESGKKITEVMTGIDGAVHYFKGSVDYVQLVSVSGKAKITGTHEYQVCSDKMCLPPKSKSFSFDLKP